MHILTGVRTIASLLFLGASNITGGEAKEIIGVEENNKVAVARI